MALTLLTVAATAAPAPGTRTAPAPGTGTAPGSEAAPAVRFSTDFECGLQHPVTDLGSPGIKTPGSGTPQNPAHFEVTFPPGRQEAGFFLFRLDHTAGKTVRVDLRTDRAVNWANLNPVFAAVDPLVEKHGNDPSGGTDAILADPILYTAKPPPDLGRDVKLPQGLGGSALPLTHGIFQLWQYMPRSGISPDKKTFRVEHTFSKDQNTVLVAMKVPYTPKLLDHLMADLKTRWDEENAKSTRTTPDWQVVEVGKSAEGKPLWLVRIGEAVERDPDQPAFAPPPEAKRSKRPVILFYAREHADEHDTSWVAQGVIDFLLSNNPDAKAIRKRATVLVVPLLDPDGAVANQYETDVIMGFEDDPDRTPEALAWAGFFQGWVNAGNRLDLVFNLHNVESGEGPHLFVYMNDPRREDMCHALHKSIAAALTDYKTRDTDTTGTFSTRLGGWLRETFGSHMMFYEVNSQAPERHLSLYELKAVGAGILIGGVKHLVVPASIPLRRELEKDRYIRYAQMERYGYLDRIFYPEIDVFDAESSYGLEGLENFYKKDGLRPGWMKPLYDKIDSGELPAQPHWWNIP